LEKSVKNSSQLTDKQRQIVDGIIVTVSARLYYLLKTMDEPENYTKKFLRVASSKEMRSLSYLLLDIKNRCGPDRALFPFDLNQQLAKVLANESSQYLEGPALRKILKILEDAGIVLNIRGKKDVKHNIGRNLKKQKKGGDSKSSNRGGQYSVYKLTSNVQDLLNVLSNPAAIQIIHRTLKDSGLLNKVFEKLFFVLAHLFTTCNTEKTAENSLLSFLPVMPDTGRDESEIKNLSVQPIATIFSKINDKTLLQYPATQFANAITADSMLNTLYVLLAIPRL
jgi:hypothetical protein